MTVATTNLIKCVETLEASINLLKAESPGSIAYEVYRNAVIKGFELSLEVSGKLLRKALKEFSADPKEIDALFYKDVFRLAGKHGLLSDEEVLRWFQYRDNRNNTAHDYGSEFAEITIALIQGFIHDVRSLASKIH